MVGFKRRMNFETVCNGRSRSSKVVDVGNNQNSVCNFLFGVNSNLDPILTRFIDSAVFLLKQLLHAPYSTQILAMFRWD